jgi:NodT family efflux transporter outer membrane factor (OMF) lipoprotein
MSIPPRISSKALSAALALSLAGCAAVGPDYVPPEPAAPDTWRAELAGGLAAGPLDDASLAHWWRNLDDPQLADLAERAVAGNLDLAEARSRLDEARARRALAGAELGPSLSAAGSAGRSASSEAVGGGDARNRFEAGFDADWELDVFGGKRRGREAADADLAASREDLRDTLVSLLGEVGLNYVELRTTQQRLAIARANLAAQQETYDLTRWRHQAGLTTELDVAQAHTNLEQTRAQIPTLRTALTQARNRLAVLLGLPPGALDAELEEARAVPVATAALAVGVPADALRRRPDVRRAERTLAARTARIGEAEAARYPDLSLSGSIGLEALTAGDLLSASALTSSLLGRIAATLFDGGRLRQNVAIQSAQAEQALVAYEAAVLNALEEVESALADYAGFLARRDALGAAADSARKAAELAANRYASGLVDFQVVLDTQRTLLSLEDQRASAEGEVSAGLIRLYKALGGGWSAIARDEVL